MNVRKAGGVSVVEFEIDGGVLSPADLGGAVAQFSTLAVDWMGGVVFSGRGPVWLYATLCHAAHPAAWVGTYEPRSGGAVVVERHADNAPAIGAIVPC